jgi:hypothetical protein
MREYHPKLFNMASFHKCSILFLINHSLIWRYIEVQSTSVRTTDAIFLYLPVQKGKPKLLSWNGRPSLKVLVNDFHVIRYERHARNELRNSVWFPNLSRRTYQFIAKQEQLSLKVTAFRELNLNAVSVSDILMYRQAGRSSILSACLLHLSSTH